MTQSPFAGIDFSRFYEWEKIVAPTGAVYYIVPGTGYVYDPFLSAAKGRPVLWTNPKPAVDEKNRAEEERKEAEKDAKKARSPAMQGTMIAAAAGAPVVANAALDHFTTSPQEMLAQAQVNALSNGTAQINGQGAIAPAAQPSPVTSPTAPAVPPAATATAPSASQGAFLQGAGVDAAGVTTAPGAPEIVSAQRVPVEGTGITAGQVAQGVGGGIQAWQGYNQWQDGNEVQGGLNMAAGTANVAQATGLMASGGALVPGLNVAAYYAPSYIEYGEKLASGDVDSDSAVKSAMLSNPITAWAVPVADALGLDIKSGKHKDQLMRDQVRDFMWKNKFIDDEFNLTLADGTKFNIGVDGESRPFNVNMEDPRASEAIGLVQGLAAAMTGGDGKMKDDFTGYFANAILAGGDMYANARKLYQDAGFQAPQQVFDVLGTLEIEEEKKKAFHNGVNQAFASSGAPMVPVAPTAAPEAPVATGAQPEPKADSKIVLKGGGAYKVPESQRVELAETTKPVDAFAQAALSGAPAAAPAGVTALSNPGNIRPIPNFMGGTFTLPAQAQPAAVKPVGPVSVPTAPSGPVQLQPTTPPGMPARSETKSPGIGKDGKRLSQEEIGRLLAKRMNRRVA